MTQKDRAGPHVKLPAVSLQGQKPQGLRELLRLPVLKVLDFTNEMLLWKLGSGAVCESLGRDGGLVHGSVLSLCSPLVLGQSWQWRLSSPWKSHTVTIQVSKRCYRQQ